MKDSILKGTGNSRFLKSAIPDGTTWAEALAMLRAGTFPMDLNGINNAGFQQVGTPLNKANLLKDVNALTLGLTGDATPDDMFNVLAHAGDLHVWKKTVVTKDPVPAGYTLGEVIENQRICFPVSSSDTSTYFTRAKAIKVSEDGKISLDTSAGSWTGTPTVGLETLTVSDYFVSITGKPSSSDLVVGDVYYVPTGGSIILESNLFKMTKLQKVIGHPYQPAGTTVTYPVSTNRNAYQEGSDAKPAGYVVGEEVSGKFVIRAYPSVWEYASSITVSDDGTINLVDASSVTLNSSGIGNAYLLVGKFCRLVSAQGTTLVFPIGSVVFFPSDITFNSSYNDSTVPKYQPVTGYPATPANTTIEYLGCLGEKGRVLFGQYIGTGTKTWTVVFPVTPKCVILSGSTLVYGDEQSVYFSNAGNSSGSRGCILTLAWDGPELTLSANTDWYPNYSGGTFRYVALC